jgi:predicted nucleotidyltransferase
MYNKTINIDTVMQVAEGLQELREKMVFIGGAVISLYTDDPAAEEIRPTQDIDLTINLGNSYGEFAALQQRLADLGFNPHHEAHAICSYRYNNIDIDIMPAEDSPIGIANSWYKPGFKYLQKVTLENGFEINILPAPYFLATKFEAFHDRGNNDFRGSPDFEDIIYVLDNRIDIVQEIQNADHEVKNYLIFQIKKILANPSANEILAMHIHPLVIGERFPMIMEKIEKILN